MKPTFDITEGLLDNGDEFTEEFYKRFTLRHGPAPLQLNDEVQKDYLFPTFYGDVTCAAGAFLCSYEKAAKMMLHPAIKPVRMPRGRAVVVFSCYIYRKVLGVAPYNEIAMTIPVMVDPVVNIPLLPMVPGGFKKFGYYVFSMPVTSLENQIRGLKIWGLPKVVQEINIEEKDGFCTTESKEESGETYFKLHAPTKGKLTKMDVTSNLYSRLDNKLLQSQTNFKADFMINKYPKVLFRKNVKPERTYLELGDTPSARVLKDLEIEQQPLQFQFAHKMTSCFDLHNSDYKPPFEFKD